MSVGRGEGVGAVFYLAVRELVGSVIGKGSGNHLPGGFLFSFFV